MEQMEELEDVSKVFSTEVCTACETVCGVRRRDKGVKSTAWWNEKVKKAMEEKKKAYRDWSGGRGNGDVEKQQREKYQEKKRGKESG